MKQYEMKKELERVCAEFDSMKPRERYEVVRQLMHTARYMVTRISTDLREETAAARHREAKRRETAVDPKPPIKPITVAEPSKPKKPKYKGL